MKRPKYTELERKLMDLTQALLREIDRPGDIHWKQAKKIVKQMKQGA